MGTGSTPATFSSRVRIVAHTSSGNIQVGSRSPDLADSVSAIGTPRKGSAGVDSQPSSCRQKPESSRSTTTRLVEYAADKEAGQGTDERRGQAGPEWRSVETSCLIKGRRMRPPLTRTIDRYSPTPRTCWHLEFRCPARLLVLSITATRRTHPTNLVRPTTAATLALTG